MFLRLYVVSQVIYVSVDILLTGVCSIIFILAIVLSVLCFTVFVYPFDVFKLVLVQIK